jgi:chemotaxis protein MotB
VTHAETRRERRRAFAAANSAPGHDRWLVSYADFVTLLLAVFVVLFAYALQNQGIHSMSRAIHTGFNSLGVGNSKFETASSSPSIAAATPTTNPSPKPAPTPPKPIVDTAELNKQLHGVLGDAIDRKEIVMQQTPDGLVISLRELGFFNSGGADLLPGASDKLQRAAQVLMEHGLEVRIEGHSDDQPIHNAAFNSNWELSTARAMSVLSMLVDHAGFPPTKISVAGYGPYHPVASNDTAEGRRQNRRVDLVVISPRGAEEQLH